MKQVINNQLHNFTNIKDSNKKIQVKKLDISQDKEVKVFS